MCNIESLLIDPLLIDGDRREFCYKQSLFLHGFSAKVIQTYFTKIKKIFTSPSQSIMKIIKKHITYYSSPHTREIIPIESIPEGDDIIMYIDNLAAGF